VGYRAATIAVAARQIRSNGSIDAAAPGRDRHRPGVRRPVARPGRHLVNIFNAPDGGWGIGGRAYTRDDLVAAITAAAAG
jgi:hypothetical protein